MVSEGFQGIMEASMVVRAEASIEHEKGFYKYPSKHCLYLQVEFILYIYMMLYPQGSKIMKNWYCFSL